MRQDTDIMVKDLDKVTLESRLPSSPAGKPAARATASSPYFLPYGQTVRLLWPALDGVDFEPGLAWHGLRPESRLPSSPAGKPAARATASSPYFLPYGQTVRLLWPVRDGVDFESGLAWHGLRPESRLPSSPAGKNRGLKA